MPGGTASFLLLHELQGAGMQYPIFGYAPGEAYVDIPSVAFYKALLDNKLLAPSGLLYGTNPLMFPPNIFSINLGGDASIVGSEDVIVLPLSKIAITIGRSFGRWFDYAGDVAQEWRGSIPFSVWTNNQEGQDEVEQRLQFARGHRINVFESAGLTLQGGTVPARPRANSPITGLCVVDYRWEFWYSLP